MPEGNRAKIEMEHKELIAFIGTLVLSLVFVFLSKMYPHYAAVTGIVIVVCVGLILLFKTLESKNVFGKNMTYVWMALTFGFMLIFVTLLNYGTVPYWFYSDANPMAITVANALIYALITITVISLVYVAYVYKTGKNPLKKVVPSSTEKMQAKYFSRR